jgi:hypothetical protein
MMPFGERGGAFHAPLAAPIDGGGWNGIVTGEAAGSFERVDAVRLGVTGNAERVPAALWAAERGWR